MAVRSIRQGRVWAWIILPVVAAYPIMVVVEIPSAEHAFDVIPNGPSGQLSLYYTERFLAWALTRTPPDREP